MWSLIFILSSWMLIVSGFMESESCNQPTFKNQKWAFHCFDGKQCLRTTIGVCDDFFTNAACDDNSNLNHLLCGRKVNKYMFATL